jgi:NADH:ubiquinone oxidoreductase subunit K
MFFWTYFSFIFIFILGIYSLISNRVNLIQTLISFEILLLSLLLNFTLISIIQNSVSIIIISILITVIAASESALGLTIIIYFYKLRGSISPSNLISLKN